MTTTRQTIEAFAKKARLPKPLFTTWDFTRISNLDACESVRDYFASSVPVSTLDFGHIRLLSPTHLDQENTELIPGCDTSPHGILTFAATDTGDSASVDLATGVVYIVSHDKFEGDMISPGWKPDLSGFFDSIPITRANILSICGDGWPDIHTALNSLLDQEER